ncbi:MAG: aminoacetone oxidase family FAD-binding enzyme, partial [Proteobacteria bacterium]|nr:aminoacetone oxidase family FAD-binding enzyme [Pseudomonadota bacterium]
GLPLKNCVLKNSKGEKAGELVITRYGIEGTPVYFLGEKGPAYLDLKPSMTEESILSRLNAIKENLSPIRRVKKSLSLSPGAMALLFHHTSAEDRQSVERMVHRIKNFEIDLLGPRPLLEAISSRGGVDLEEVSTEPGSELMLKRFPGVFAGGEMLAWSAPTGGFLIQGAVTQGAVAGANMLRYLKSDLVRSP